MLNDERLEEKQNLSQDHARNGQSDFQIKAFSSAFLKMKIWSSRDDSPNSLDEILTSSTIWRRK